jgi:RNA polymerase sigma-70 factor (ECF subfamily)
MSGCVTVMELPPLTTEDDDAFDGALALSQRWFLGDEEALRLAFDAWGGAIHTYCQRRLPLDEATDATQEVFVSAWRKRDQFDPSRGSLPGWLFGIARNTCVDLHRRRARRPDPVPEPVPAPSTAAPVGDDVADRLLLAGALEQLPARQRSVLVASFVDGHTNQEVADRLGLPLGTVKSDVRRGLRTLRGILEGSR